MTGDNYRNPWCLQNELQAFEKQMHDLRKSLGYFIRETEYDLKERWAIFCLAPSCLKFRMLHVPMFIHNDKTLQNLLHEHFDYGQEIQVVDYLWFVPQENQNDVKEEFLAKSCGSFFYVPPPNS